MVGARILKLWMIIALFCASLAMPAYGQVTGKDGGASSFATSNGPGALGDPTQLVPGVSSNSDGLASHYTNPDGLKTAGQGAVAGNEIFGLMANGSANSAKYGFTANDDWLKKSLGLVADPSDGSGVIGEASQSCQDKTVTRSETSLYTCETATPITDVNRSCTRDYQPEFDTDYVYECRAGTEWRAETGTCEPERVVVVDEDYVYACQIGTVWSQTPSSCTRKRVVVVDEDYSYLCRTGTEWSQVPTSCTRKRVVVVDEDYAYACRLGTEWSQTANSCTKGRVVVVDEDYAYGCRAGTEWSQSQTSCTRKRIVQVDEDYSYGCRLGDLWTSSPASCERKRVVVVDEDYDYSCVQTWNGAAHQANAACTANGAPGCQASTARVCSQASNLAQSYVCQEGYSGSVTNYSCTRSQTPTVSILRAGQLIASCIGERSAVVSGLTSLQAGCSYGMPLELNFGYNSSYMIDTACSSEPNFPSSATFGGATCNIVYYSGAASGTDLGGGTTDTCGAYGACTKTADVCVEGAGTRTVNGVGVYRDCWKWDLSYRCGSRTDYAGCSPPTGLTPSTQTCIASSGGVCTASQKTYVDPSGGCLAYSQTHRCTDLVAGAGTPSQVIRNLVSDTWDNGCTALASNAACTKTSEAATVGSQTRTINGLAVTRDPWAVQENYSCQTSTAVNSCSSLTSAGCMVLTSTCASTDRNNSCTAWDRTYRCENAVTGSGPVIDTPRDVISDIWDAGCTSLASNAACTKTSEVATVGSQTRSINGLAVTKDPWEVQETYSCWASANVNSCTALTTAGCSEVSNSCASRDRTNVCTAWDRTYRCESPVSGVGPVVDTPRDVISDTWDAGCTALASNAACAKTSETATVGSQTRTINGLEVTRDPWALQENYSCWASTTVNSCAALTSAGCTVLTSTCASTDRTNSCTAWDRTYRCETPVSGSGTVIDTPRDIISDTWDAGCTALAGNSACTKTSETTTVGSQTRTINGLAVTKDPWEVQETYSCWTGTEVNSCTALTNAGCSEVANSCVSRGRTNVCTAWDRTYRCEAPVSGSGTVTDTPRDVVSDSWDAGCTSLAANSACAKQSETTTVGSQTRTINGLTVTKDPWEVREDYICWSSTTANNCTPFVGCAETASTCASTDRAGSCSAFNKTYRCENPANGGGTVTETPRDVVGEYWTDPCATKRNDPACSRTSDEVLIGAQTRIINGLSVTRDPWQRRETWVCNRSDAVDSCGPVAGCTLIAKSCGSYSPDGRCTLDTNRYRCENEVTGQTPVDLPKDWTGGTLKDNACPSSGNGACTKTGTLCSQAGQTRLIDGVAVTPSCWQETDSFTCEETGGTASSCSPPSGCTYIGQTCLDDVPDDQCKAWDNRYSCKTDISETTNSCKAKVCVGDICIGSDDEADSDMADAMSKLLVAKLASNDVSNSLTIFKGTPMRCRKALFGFNNCCKDAGWGQDLGLAQCSEEEKTLITRQEAKSVHYVGTYCSKKSFFGICREKAMRYCAFDGALARIVQQAGRPQLGKGWGTPANADCSGFTVEEFENLDLTHVDFSEFTTQLMAKFSAPDGSGIVDRMKASFGSMMGSGSPGFGEITEAKDEGP